MCIGETFIYYAQRTQNKVEDKEVRAFNSKACVLLLFRLHIAKVDTCSTYFIVNSIRIVLKIT